MAILDCGMWISGCVLNVCQWLCIVGEEFAVGKIDPPLNHKLLHLTKMLKINSRICKKFMPCFFNFILLIFF